ncbi:MAG: filamentous hemagglutinin N-terminal domain-containing protein, partial [Azoarcus sp.]|nr:filamentous hemagglutinin N-terminal domain-containing protein [Azoarcus sp.]
MTSTPPPPRFHLNNLGRPFPPASGFLSPRWMRWMRWTARLLILTLAVHPTLGLTQGVVPATPATQVTQPAGQKAPVVNIARPNAAGLSHNQYQHYNVGPEGLILNNSHQPYTNTQLNGYITGNPNLTGNAARLLLNEVTGASRSQLLGTTEIAGSAAHLIVANPHGITCDGCGFLNTPRVTLATGQPVLQNGQLTHYDIRGGDILIDGAGLNAGDIDRFELLTRAARLNAALHARQLDLRLGANRIDAQTLGVSALDSAAPVPVLAIDSSALGGMYVDAIRLIATEHGVGVRLAGDLIASASDIAIDAAGALTLNRIAAQGDLNLSAPQLTLEGDTYAGGRARLSTAGTLRLAGSLSVAQALQIAADQLDNRGRIETGLAPDGSLRSAPLELTVARLLNRGEILARGPLTGSGGDWHNTGTLATSGLLELSLETLANSDGGLLFSGGDARFLLETLANTEADLVVGGNLTIARNAAGEAARTVANRSGAIDVAGDLKIAAGAYVNERTVLETETRKISAQLTNFHCTGHSACDGTNLYYDLTLQEIDRTQVTQASAPAWLIVGGDLQILGDTAKNDSSIIGVGGDIRIQAAFDNRGVQTGDILAKRSLHTQRIRGNSDSNGRYTLDQHRTAIANFNARNSVNAQADVEAQINAYLRNYIDLPWSGAPVLTYRPDDDAAAYSGVIQAGGDLYLQGEKVAQNVLWSYYTLNTGGQTAEGAPGTQIVLHPQLPADLTQKLIDPLSLPGAERPSQRFRHAPADRPYLIETNPLFTDLKTFLSSNHLLGLLGLDPNDLQRRLGDGGVEQKLLRDAVLARTGQRFLDGYTDDETQYLALMENAAAEQ